jgi:ribulose-5-phosphate 4-epimerase/fuculose-1-phosphate aldolase
VYEEDDPRDMLVNNVRLGAALAETFGTNVTQPTSPLRTAVLQRGHGFVVVAESVEQAVDYAYYTSTNARVQTKALLLGGATGGEVEYLSGRERKDSKDMNAWIAFKPWRQWVWEVERSGMYENELGTPTGA